jgi:hypothetical protein
METMKNRRIKYSVFSVILFFIAGPQVMSQIPSGYKGTPYKDSVYQTGAQNIPGRIELAFYDFGGEGIAYHDTDTANNGSLLNRSEGHCRPGISESICFFRESEGVDISYTKDWADFNHPNKTDPKVNQLYIGWQEDGEWTNYTVDIKVKGRYKIVTVYGNHDNSSTLWLNHIKLTDIKLPEDTGNWHYWTQATVAETTIDKTGLNLLTLKYNSGANLAYLDFILIEAID